MRITRAALLIALAFGAVGYTTPAQATCVVDVRQPVGLGVCFSVKPEPGRGTCAHVAVYTTTPTDPDPLLCTGV